VEVIKLGSNKRKDELEREYTGNNLFTETKKFCVAY